MSIREFSLKYGIDERLVKAVAIVESSGSGFNEDNSLKIRVEAHLILNKYPHLSKWFNVGTPSFLEHYYKFPSYSSRWRSIHTGNYFDEYQALLTASFQIGNLSFDFVSMGSFQIMGFHFDKLGFRNSLEMFTFASQSKENDLEVGLRFIESSDSLIKALQQRDFYRFALLYNGNNADVYSERIEREYNKL